MEDIFRIIRQIGEDSCPSVLATVIRAQGHSYRKPGACMLFAGNGERVGSISPGCLESDLEQRIEEVWRRGIHEAVEYDMSRTDDFGWGEAVGCGGRIQVLLEPVAGCLRSLLLEAGTHLEAGASVRLIRQLKEDGIQYVLETAQIDSTPPASASGVIGASPMPALGQDSGPGDMGNKVPGSAIGYELTISPPPRLIVFGAGNDAKPVVRLAHGIGFRIIVADWREALCVPARFPEAEVCYGSVEELSGVLSIGQGDYVLILSHQFQKDKRFLEEVVAASPAYIGIMGSRQRLQGLLEHLPSSIPGLHGPVGLPIGAEGPEEIAVSIAAELIRVKRSKGSTMTWKELG